MEKKTYSKPLMAAQQFEPQEFVAVCPPSETYVTYEFWCDASVTAYGATYGYYHIYLDNGDGVFDERTDTDLTQGQVYSPCGETHSVTVPIGTSIDDVFPKGWLVPLRNYTYQEVTSRTIPVRVWRGENGDNGHCTRQLNEDEFTIKNPS